MQVKVHCEYHGYPAKYTRPWSAMNKGINVLYWLLMFSDVFSTIHTSSSHDSSSSHETNESHVVVAARVVVRDKGLVGKRRPIVGVAIGVAERATMVKD